ncbi:hypothetical protein OK016_03370 [Vibrio chagasii]|nr:hypothetical protein [Vibrio chagasii]
MIVGDSFKNKELMIKLVGFGIERREVVAITNIHDSSSVRSIPTAKAIKLAVLKI